MKKLRPQKGQNKNESQSPAAQNTSLTERQILRAYRSMTLAAGHLDTARQSLTNASKSQSFARLADSYQSLFGMRGSQCSLLLRTVIDMLMNGQPEISAIIQKKPTESWRKLADYLEQRLADDSKRSTRPAAKAVRTKVASRRQSALATPKFSQRRYLSQFIK